MKFDKTKNESKNFSILRKELLKEKNPYSRIVCDYLFSESDPDVFRSKVKEQVSKHIDNKIKTK